MGRNQVTGMSSWSEGWAWRQSISQHNVLRTVGLFLGGTGQFRGCLLASLMKSEKIILRYRSSPLLLGNRSWSLEECSGEDRVVLQVQRHNPRSSEPSSLITCGSILSFPRPSCVCYWPNVHRSLSYKSWGLGQRRQPYEWHLHLSSSILFFYFLHNPNLPLCLYSILHLDDYHSRDTSVAQQ